MKSDPVQFILGDRIGGAGSRNGDEVTVKIRTWNGAHHKP